MLTMSVFFGDFRRTGDGLRAISGRAVGEWVEEQGQFGLSVAQFSDAIGVSASSFCRWQTKLSQIPTDAPAAFVPVTLMPSAAVEVELPCGAVVHVPRDEDLIRQVPGILLERAVDGPGVR